MTEIDTAEVLAYLTYSGIVIFGVYVLPGLALVPRAIFDSRLAYAVPIMSVLVVIGLARTAKFLGMFTQEFAIIATFALAALACYRLWHHRQTTLHWPTMHRLIYLTSALLILPGAVMSSLSVFTNYDPLVVWNPWAIQHMEGLPHDQSITKGSSYPQNYPYLLAWCFHLLGSANLQLPVKSGFTMLGFSFVAAIGMVGQRRDMNAQNLLAFFAFLVLIVVLLYVGSEGGDHTFALYYYQNRWPEGLSAGYASILLVSPIVVSIALYLQHQRSPESPWYIWLAAGAAVVAGLARQEAYVWLMGAFPLLAAWDARKRKTWSTLYPVAIAWSMGLLWLMTEGSNPIHEGTMPAAFGHGERSGWFEQLQYVFDLYVLNEPTRAIVFAACTITVLLHRRGLGVFLTYLVPCFFIWTYLGAYTVRHGQYIGAIAILLIAANGFGWIPLGRYTTAAIPNQVRYLVWAIVCVIAISSTIHAGALAHKTINDHGSEFSFLDARKNLMSRLFGDHAAYVYREIVLKESTVWISAQYARGIFHGSNPLLFHRDIPPLDDQSIKAQIKRKAPDYLVLDMRWGKYSRRLEFFIEKCLDWFELVAVSSEHHRLNVYRLDKEAMESARCAVPPGH